MTWSLKVPEVPAGNIDGVLNRVATTAHVDTIHAADASLAVETIRDMVAEGSHRGVVSAEASGDGTFITVTVRRHD